MFNLQSSSIVRGGPRRTLFQTPDELSRRRRASSRPSSDTVDRFVQSAEVPAKALSQVGVIVRNQMLEVSEVSLWDRILAEVAGRSELSGLSQVDLKKAAIDAYLTKGLWELWAQKQNNENGKRKRGSNSVEFGGAFSTVDFSRLAAAIARRMPQDFPDSSLSVTLLNRRLRSLRRMVELELEDDRRAAVRPAVVRRTKRAALSNVSNDRPSPLATRKK